MTILKLNLSAARASKIIGAAVFYQIFFSLFWILASTNLAYAQKGNITKPKLVVAVVIDQMRYDLLYRYLPKMGKGGFRKLLEKGYSFENTHYDYVPTVTGPGHASIFTGSTPAYHGIVGNDWHNYSIGKESYCVGDSSVLGLGTDTKYGLRSPKNLLATTITDELKIASPRSKIVGVSHKDRGAILPSGHMADAAYWYDFAKGKMISSSYYQDSLPAWVQNFNRRYTPDSYMASAWNLYLPQRLYQNYLPDHNKYEAPTFERDSTSFPHRFENIKDPKKRAYWFSFTPFANDYLTQFAQAAIWAHGLGLDTETDFLTVSYSSPDLIGHNFGLRSLELEDCYIRLDKNIQQLMESLDKQVGSNNYILFLTADHGAADIPSLANEVFHLNTKATSYQEVSAYLDSCLSKMYGVEKWVVQQESEAIYLNRRAVLKKGLSLAEVRQKAASLMETRQGVLDAITADELQTRNLTDELYVKAQRGFHIERSADLLLFMYPGWFMGPLEGTTHSTGYVYDCQVPLLWYGRGVKKGSSVRKVSILDIVPTLAAWLHLQQPSSAIGLPLYELFQK